MERPKLTHAHTLTQRRARDEHTFLTILLLPVLMCQRSPSEGRKILPSIIHDLQSAPKITRTQSGFPELGKQQNIAHGICPIVRSQRQSVHGTFPSNGKHRGLDNTSTRNRPTRSLVSLSSFGFFFAETQIPT